MKFEDFLKFFAEKFGSKEKMRTFAIPFGEYAEIAQLVEHNLAKVRVASSSLVFRSKRVSRNADLTFEKESATQLHGASAHEYSPDGVQSYVSRPCAQGRLFYLYAAQHPQHGHRCSWGSTNPHLNSNWSYMAKIN